MTECYVICNTDFIALIYIKRQNLEIYTNKSFLILSLQPNPFPLPFEIPFENE